MDTASLPIPGAFIQLPQPVSPQVSVPATDFGRCIPELPVMTVVDQFVGCASSAQCVWTLTWLAIRVRFVLSLSFV